MPSTATTILGDLVGPAVWDAIKNSFKTWMNKTGEKVGEHTADYISLKLFGVKSEDERRFNMALTKLDANEATVLLTRLGRLLTHQSDYYRITVMRDNPDETVEILRSHAQMTDPDWANLVVVMNYNQTLDQARLVRFGQWIATQAVATNAALNTQTAWMDPINNNLRSRLAARQGRKGTLRSILRSFIPGLR